MLRYVVTSGQWFHNNINVLHLRIRLKSITDMLYSHTVIDNVWMHGKQSVVAALTDQYVDYLR